MSDDNLSRAERMIQLASQLTGNESENAIRFLLAMEERDPFSCTAITMPAMSFWNQSAKTESQKRHIIDRANTLQKGINLPVHSKLDITERIIKRAFQVEGVKWAISYSGGRDSTVLSHIVVERMGIRVPHVMSNTRMEYPETIQQVKNWYERMRAQGVECHTCFPKRRPNELWKSIGVPLWSKEVAYKYRKFAKSASDKISKHVPEHLHAAFRKAKALGLKITDKCCDELKKKPMKAWDKEHGIGGHFMGVRCAESRARRLAWIQKGALYQAATHGNMWVVPIRWRSGPSRISSSGFVTTISRCCGRTHRRAGPAALPACSAATPEQRREPRTTCRI